MRYRFADDKFPSYPKSPPAASLPLQPSPTLRQIHDHLSFFTHSLLQLLLFPPATPCQYQCHAQDPLGPQSVQPST